MQLIRQRAEVRLVSPVLQVACDLGLLRLRSAAPHRVDPLAHLAGAVGELPDAPGLIGYISWGQRYPSGGCSRTPWRPFSVGSPQIGSPARVLALQAYAPAVLGPETLLYTAFRNSAGVYEIPFLICMGLSFAITMVLMVAVSLAGPVVNARSIQLDASMFRVSTQTMTLIVITMLMLTALYTKFW